MRILVVEDSITMRGIICSMLDKLGYDDVADASDGREAWEKLKRERFDILVTDWNMPMMSGLELLQRVRQSHLLAELPVITLTARNNEEDIGVGIGPCTDYLTKPCKPSELKAKIDQVIRQIAPEEPTKIPSRSTVETNLKALL